MKLKILFSEPPHPKLFNVYSPDEKIVVIRSPYTITQEKLGATRIIQNEEGTQVTYEQYGVEMKTLIRKTINSSKLGAYSPFDTIEIVNFQQPSNFKEVCVTLKRSSLPLMPGCQLIFKNCFFGGLSYVDSVSSLIKSAQKLQEVSFKVTLEEPDNTRLSAHDEVRLASLKGVVFFRTPVSPAAMKPFWDDSLVGINRKPKNTGRFIGKKLRDTLENPTYYYRGSLLSATHPEKMMKFFFSQEAQQQTDYTCGPASIQMVANYYETMRTRRFCGEPITHQSTWREISISPQMRLAAKVATTEAKGSDIKEISVGLLKEGLSVFAHSGISNKTYTEAELSVHKERMWQRMKEIVKLGIPVILNMHDKDECGHYEVAIGIEQVAGFNKKRGTHEEYEQVILAEPGTGLVGALAFETLKKDVFLPRWKSMSGEFHGGFMVLPPNAAAVKAVESILVEIPYSYHGEEKNRTATRAPAL